MALSPLAEHFFLFIVACGVLVFSGSLVLRQLITIGRFLRLSEFLVAYTVMAVATSIPELFVGITAALAKKPQLSLGTVIGSNIADITLVIGIAILLGRGIRVQQQEIKRETTLMVGIACLPLVLMYIGETISRLDGVILLGTFFLYQYEVFRHKRGYSKQLTDDIQKWRAILAPLLFAVGIAILFGSSHYVVKYASLLSLDLAVPPILIGLILIALGTSLPELIFEARAVLEGHSQMALGDAIGSVIANSTLVLGVTAVIFPITANMMFFLVSILFMIIAVLVFATLIKTATRLTWYMGLMLVLFYITFLIMEFYVRNLQGVS